MLTQETLNKRQHLSFAQMGPQRREAARWCRMRDLIIVSRPSHSSQPPASLHLSYGTFHPRSSTITTPGSPFPTSCRDDPLKPFDMKRLLCPGNDYWDKHDGCSHVSLLFPLVLCKAKDYTFASSGTVSWPIISESSLGNCLANTFSTPASESRKQNLSTQLTKYCQ